MVQFAFLTTDILLFLMLVLLILFLVAGFRSKQFRISWRQMLTKPLAMSSMVILCFYLCVGFLDSIHFRALTERGTYSVKVYSLLDKVVGGSIVEKTYSAPLATHGYNKDSRLTPDGRIVRFYLPLKHIPGDILASTQHHKDHLTMIIVKASLFSLIVWLALIYCWIVISAKNRPVASALNDFVKGRLDLAWRSFWVTVGFLIFFLFIAYQLSLYYHLLGTNKVGQDVFYESLKGIRTALLIGSLTTLFMLPFAILLGTLAGYFGGVIDDIIQYIYTTLSSIPGVLLIAAAILSIQVYIDNHPNTFSSLASRADARLITLCIILGVTSWTNLCRVLRAETLKLRELDFIQAAKALGAGHLRITLNHIVPNMVHIILISAVLDFSNLILAEAVLTYVGVGVDPTTFSWGNMIDSARLEFAREPVVWWPLLGAFSFMFIFVLSANLFADAMRDAFDPRSRFAD